MSARKLIVWGALIGSGVITWALYPAPTPSERWLQEQQDQWNLRVAEARGDAKKMVMASLRDPYSAVLGELVTHEIILDNKSVMAVCGSINAKNGFGGYVGERRFVYLGSQIGVRYERDPIFQRVWPQACSR